MLYSMLCKKNPSRPCPGNLMRGFAKDCKLQAQIYGLLDQYIMPDKIFQQIRFPGNGKVTKYNGKEFFQQSLWNTYALSSSFQTYTKITIWRMHCILVWNYIYIWWLHQTFATSSRQSCIILTKKFTVKIKKYKW